MTAPRVVSLVPSVTETVLALGVQPVACTRFCEQPELATVGGTKNPDVNGILALRPDLVVMNDEENRRVDYEALRDAGLDVLDVSPRSVDDVGGAVQVLAAALDVPVPAPFDDWHAWLAGHRAPRATRTVVTMVWRRPWMMLGSDTYAASLLTFLGCTTLVADDESGARYPETTLDVVARLAPDIVLLPSEPYAFADRHQEEVGAAVPDAAVEFVDGQDLFWWGIRTPGAITSLAAHLV